MAQMLMFAKNNVNPDPTKDQRGSWKRGYIVVVVGDDHAWGAEETPYGKTTAQRKFVLIKIPGASVAQVQKYVDMVTQIDQFTGENVTTHRRRWQVRWNDLPAAAQDRLRIDGEIIVKAGTYAGTFDYTWTQVKGFFRNVETGLDETAEL